MNDYKVTKEQIFARTDGGQKVIEHYYPQSSQCFGRGSHRNFKIRPDDRNPSCCVFQKEGVWFIQDKGGSDTKAYTAIQLVMREEGLEFGQAIEWIARHFAPDLLDQERALQADAKPLITEAAPVDQIQIHLREGGKFTQRELEFLGWNITQENCDQLCLKPLDYYITARNRSGKSFKVEATDRYPMYFYDYGMYGKDEGQSPWGKIYQPLGDVRFLYYGSKPENFMFGDRDFLAAYAKALRGIYPGKAKLSEDGQEQSEVSVRYKHLVICSGPSDALNVRAASTDRNDYHVCWLNSETADLTEYEYSNLAHLADNLYILYDLDETGLHHMYRLALRYLDLRVVQLPEGLKRYRDRKGHPCKDAKDFFMYYRLPEAQNPRSIFADLMKLSGSLKFWQGITSKTGKLSYDINNEQLYAFLAASGYHKMPTVTTAKGYTYCHIDSNVITLIDESAIESHCSSFLLQYLKTHPKYYNQALANAIYRSKQISPASLAKMQSFEPNFKSWTETADYFFFRNGIFRCTADGVAKIKASDCPCHILSSKIIDADLTPVERFFDIEYSDEYKDLLGQLRSSVPRSPEYFALQSRIDALKDIDRYRLKIYHNDLTFMQYVYNTGRVNWRKEEMGIPLTDQERREHDLYFISKVMALGFLLAKHKNQSQPYAVFCMETELSDEGTHLGGTGKSLFASSLEKMRKQVFIDGQAVDMKGNNFMLSNVEKGVTDSVFIDDLHAGVDLHKFMPMITGKMTVTGKYVNSYTIDFKDSPKVIFTSNHAISHFDASLRRRTWFAAFSDYYHAEDSQRGLKERNPQTEFGKDLITDYSEAEMNLFYNFMLNCLQVWMKLQVRIQPPMQNIDRRLLQRKITDEFIFWAEDYFTDDRLNKLVDRDAAFKAYQDTLPPKFAQNCKPKGFKQKLIAFCEYKQWLFNPKVMMQTTSELERNDIRRKVNGEDHYFFYIDTRGQYASDDNTQGDVQGGGEQRPDESQIQTFEDEKPF